MRGLLMAFLAFDFTGRHASGGERARGVSTKTAAKKTTVTTV